MIEGHKDSGAGKEDRDSLTQEGRDKKKKDGRYRNEIVREKIEQESEIDATLTPFPVNFFPNDSMNAFKNS